MEKKIAIKIFKELLNELKMNPKQLSEAIGKNRPQWAYDVLNEEKNVGISKNVAELICSNFPQINKSYLLTGEGTLLIEESNAVEVPLEEKSTYYTEPHNGTPVYDIDATCGTESRDMDFTDEHIVGYVDLPGVNKNACIIRANGDSMEPRIFDGNMVVIREIKNWEDVFYGQIYLILLDEYRMIKYIRRYEPDEGNYIILRSENPKYDDIKLHKSKIRKLFIVENILSVRAQL